MLWEPTHNDQDLSVLLETKTIHKDDVDERTKTMKHNMNYYIHKSIASQGNQNNVVLLLKPCYLKIPLNLMNTPITC